MTKMTRTEIINHLIAKNNYTSYLEIGLDNGINFMNVKCQNKESVDPFMKNDHENYDFTYKDDIPEKIKKLLTYRMTSDEFFKICVKKYDIIFIDGLHTQEQVGRDIINSLKVLNENGMIVVHDCLPNSEEAQKVPRVQGEWNGDVWKGVYELIRQGLDIRVVDTDYGCGIIRHCSDESLLFYPEKSKAMWQDFIRDRNKMMNVISVEQFIEQFK